MSVIRRKENIYSYGSGPLLCCSPAAAKELGIAAALLFNNMLALASEEKQFEEQPKLDAYYPLDSAFTMNDLSEILDPLVLQAMAEHLQDEGYIKLKKTDEKLQYEILYDKYNSDI